jgi:hypothetical protein
VNRSPVESLFQVMRDAVLEHSARGAIALGREAKNLTISRQEIWRGWVSVLQPKPTARAIADLAAWFRELE